MADSNNQDLRDYREQAESSRDDPLPSTATRPGAQRAKVLSVRLNPDEFDELARYAAALDVPVSALVRGWILGEMGAAAESPIGTVERISHDLEQLRRQLAA